MSEPRPILMVVDDEPEVLRSLHDLFRREYRVLTFERGSEALAKLEEVDPPVILSDQRMPELSGVEFLRRAKAARPDAVRLLMTGYADIKAVIDAINEGNVFRYLTKPSEPDELIAVVRQAVEHHDLIVERRRLVAELRESNDQLREADRVKRAFIEVASHELNTPVAIVLGMADLWDLEMGADATESERSWVARIRKAGARLAGTVERMLKLLQANRFGETLARREAELAPIVRAVADDLRPYLEARHQGLELELDPGLGAAEVDASKVEDMLMNLAVNAVKFTPDGGTIRIEGRPEGADRVALAVSDEGAGIGPEERKHLFEPFFTGFDTSHHSSGDVGFGKRGIGLGLCLVKTFAELHGGTVAVESPPGGGSTFRVVLPRRAPASTSGDDGDHAPQAVAGPGLPATPPWSAR